MNFEPLYELKNRLENVAVVGINLAKDDFRLKRAVEQLKEYSTTAKVFKQIYDMGNELISTDDEDKCDLFLDLLALLDAVLCTQATTYSGNEPQEIKTIAKSKDYYKELHYSELSPLVYAFTEGNLFIIQDAVNNNADIFDDFRLKSYMIKGLSNKYSKVINLATKKLKKQRKEIVPLQKDEFSPGIEKKCLLDWILFPTLLKKMKMIFTNIALKIGLRK